MRPTEELVHEHKVIKHMLAVLGRMADKLEAGEPVAADHLTRSVDFIRNFADRCHHAKEEDLLFPAMEAAGIPRERGPIGVMLAEHAQGRGHVKEMAAAAADYPGGAEAGVRFAASARRYTSLLGQHIDKEDNVLYPMADARLSSAQQEQLEQAFVRVEREITGPGEHEKYHELVHELEKAYGAST